MARKGQFKKGGGRVGGSTHHTKRRHSTTTALAHAPRVVTKYRTRSAPKANRRTRRKHGAGGIGGVNIGHVALAAAALGYATSEKNGVAMIKDNVAKLPGAATFGVPATIGLYALGIDRFVKRNRWLRIVGVIGVAAAALKVGSEGSDFKFVGDSDVGDIDMSDDD